jgi:predicted dehydrogenase
LQSRKLRVGVIGVGSIGREQHLPAWASVPFAELTAAADLNEAVLQRATDQFAIPHRFTDWRDLVDHDLDIIDVCTPNATHLPIALTALQAGKHVLCEKPLATTAADVRKLWDVSRATGRLVMAAQNFRFDAASVELKKRADAGVFGEIYYARAQWLRRRFLPARPTFTEKALSGGGPMLDLGVHLIDLAYWLMGTPEPVSVSASAGTKLAKNPDVGGAWGDWDHERIDVEDFAAGYVRFANGATLTVETSWLAFQPEDETVRLQCYGTHGGAVWPDAVLTGEMNREPWTKRLEGLPKRTSYREQVLAFATSVRDGLPAPVPIEETLNVLRIIEGFYRSAKLGREVSLRPATARKKKVTPSRETGILLS